MDPTTVKRTWYYDSHGSGWLVTVSTTPPKGDRAEFTGTAAEFVAQLRAAGITRISPADGELTSYEVRREWAIRLKAEAYAAEHAVIFPEDAADREGLMRFALDEARREERRTRRWDHISIRMAPDYEGQRSADLLFYSNLTSGMISVIPATDTELAELRDKITVHLAERGL